LSGDAMTIIETGRRLHGLCERLRYGQRCPKATI